LATYSKHKNGKSHLKTETINQNRKIDIPYCAIAFSNIISVNILAYLKKSSYLAQPIVLNK
jgi:hypothetical protein